NQVRLGYEMLLMGFPDLEHIKARIFSHFCSFYNFLQPLARRDQFSRMRIRHMFPEGVQADFHALRAVYFRHNMRIFIFHTVTLQTLISQVYSSLRLFSNILFM